MAGLTQALLEAGDGGAFEEVVETGVVVGRVSADAEACVSQLAQSRQLTQPASFMT